MTWSIACFLLGLAWLFVAAFFVQDSPLTAVMFVAMGVFLVGTAIYIRIGEAQEKIIKAIRGQIEPAIQITEEEVRAHQS